MKKIFGTDGIRGVAYEFLTSELAENVGAALGIVLKKQKATPRVVIGGDTRESYTMLLEALTKGLCDRGIDVCVVGVVPTPAIAYFTAKCAFDAGIMISASHNPYEYNGIKIFAEGGFKLSDEKEEEIERILASTVLQSEESRKGTVVSSPELKEKYLEYIKNYAPQKKLDIFAVIDCANGSASATAKDVFSFLGDKTVYIGISPDGKNINQSCGSTHIDLLAKRVKELHADIGLAFDGDADRFLAIDENGNEVDGDFVLAILAESFHEKGKLDMQTIVGTVMTNYGFSKFADDKGYTFIPTKVGDRYVLEEMEKGGYALGGEQSGHTIIREAATTGDGQLTAVYILSRMAETGLTLSSLAGVMKKFPQRMVNIRATDEEKTKIKTDERIIEIIKEAEARLGNTGRLLIRPSGTEPVVRIMVECLDENLAVSLTDELCKKIKTIISQ